ncbi:MAG: hypothetical protein PWP76_173 [Candidatus Diapherotrites archaeon]|nr:hypothetical protein [Candidatus Diapherotrites archaeon]MDN5366593.1 hypothetical protein [Candidatus Diapherotrites archaeon]
MKASEEVIKTLEMLKSAGFEPVDAIFKGMITVMNKSQLEWIQGLADAKEAVGTITIIYKTPDGDVRTIEIPVGEIPGEEEEGGSQ